MYKLGIILFFMFIGHAVTAQVSGHEIKATNKDFKISLTEIIGDWYTADSSSYKISFININNYFVDINGINHGVGNYSFRIYGDSISVNGTAPNWPPYDCTLRLLNNKHLEIEFYQFFSTETTKVIYRR
jgi:hypothetical protein